jgi:hypothetical protein
VARKPPVKRLLENAGSQGGEYEDDTFWDSAYSFVEVYRRFRDAVIVLMMKAVCAS